MCATDTTVFNRASLLQVGFLFHKRCPSTCANWRVWVQLLMLLSKFTKCRRRTAGTASVCSRTSRLHNSWLISHVLAVVKKQEQQEEKTSLNSPPRLSLKPFILIPVDTCYFFDGKYKAVQHQTSLWYESTNLNQIYSRCSLAIWVYPWVLLGSGGMLCVQKWG